MSRITAWAILALTAGPVGWNLLGGTAVAQQSIRLRLPEGSVAPPPQVHTVMDVPEASPWLPQTTVPGNYAPPGGYTTPSTGGSTPWAPSTAYPGSGTVYPGATSPSPGYPGPPLSSSATPSYPGAGVAGGVSDPFAVAPYGTAPPIGSYAPGVSPPYAPSTVTPGPGGYVMPGQVATFQGGIAPPPFDPYATPGQPFEIYPGFDPFIFPSPSATATQMQRFLDSLGFDYLFIPGGSGNSLQMHDFLFHATFALPCHCGHGFYPPAVADPNCPPPMGPPPSFVYITPGFGLHLWNSSIHDEYHLPSRLYDAFLATEWNPLITPHFGLELAFAIGVYSDFEKVTTQSIRYTGRGVASLMLRENYMWLKGGVIYYDRERIQLLPTMGVVIMPTSDIRLDLMFPDPKVSFRIHQMDTVDYWFYVHAYYGGGSWTVSQPAGVTRIDYNDIKIGVGIKCDNTASGSFNGYFEIGAAVARELYSGGGKLVSLNPNVYISAGLSF